MNSLFLSCLLCTSVLSSVTATCQQDLNACQSAFNQALPQSRNNPGDLCHVGNTYISCLRNLADMTLHPDCATLAGTIVEDRKATEAMLRTNVTGCMLCSSEVDTCETIYQSSPSQAGHDDTHACKDGQKFVLCLRNVDEKPECVSEKPRLETSRRKAEEKLTQKGCDTGHTCQQGVQACKAQQATSKSSATTHAQQCKVSSTYCSCMTNQQCTGEYAKDVKLAVDDLLKEAKDLNCTFTYSDCTGSGAAGMTYSVLLSVTVAMAVIIKLN